MYHRFSPDGQNHPRKMPISDFSWQLEYIVRHHRAWTPNQQISENPGNGMPPVVITVDDGYNDFASLAAPLLIAQSVPAMVFVTTGFIAGQTWFWWDRLSWLLENCGAKKCDFNIGGETHLVASGDDDYRWNLWHSIADQLSVIEDERKEDALAELAISLGLVIPDVAPPEFQAMNWKQVRELLTQGISFGAHTVYHPVLSQVDTNRSAQEIDQSRQQLAAEIGATPDWFCYPQGGPDDYHDETVEQVRQAGFRGSYTARPNANHDGDPMTLPRYSISENRIDFQWVMCGAEYLLSR